ncbi:unnamed protein product, partial [Scytosiphon promiscuus]
RRGRPPARALPSQEAGYPPSRSKQGRRSAGLKDREDSTPTDAAGPALLADIPGSMARQQAAAAAAAAPATTLKEHRFNHNRLGSTGILSSSSTAEIRPEEITHGGVGLPAACAGGDIPLAAMLLAEGADAGIDMLGADADGNNPLHYACLSDSPELIRFLLRKAAGTASGLANGRRGDYEDNRLQRLAKSRMLEARNAAWETPLLRAAVGGNVAVVQTLLDEGADITAADGSQNTVFHNAARNGRLWAVAFFLSFEASKDPHQGGVGAAGDAA